MKRNIVFYKTPNGKCPVQDFLDSLPGKSAQKVAWVLSLMEDLDVVPSVYFKKLVGTEEIWECRTQFGSNACRVFCFFDGNSVVVLTHGFMKKTQKTPRSEIDRAESYRKDYLKRRSKT
ncbi:MAG: type II toxin-antitoxin system RelE/ParE family toxin [Candidatus Schekmanbacteria bacterium]|nr:type II toxin-antitoxin system RelE/ParE family toxin [Candidatus Schekmanbacteria bacterium]